MKLESILFDVVAGLLGAMAWLAWRFDRQHRQFRTGGSADHLFRCRQCGFLYTDDADVDLSRCPQCRTMNEEVEF